ncbi:MAG: hypothetical protein R3B82_25840 [Sandaracinaceae bacterium]
MRRSLLALSAILVSFGCTSINSDDPSDTPPDPFFPPGFDVPFGGATWRATEAPAPVTGGHLAVLPSGEVAAADPSSRRLYLVDPLSRNVTDRFDLGGEPGRVIADSEGGVHVVLRDAAAIASLDPVTHALTTRAVCTSPRGLGWSEEHASLYVACFDGRLQRLPRTGGTVETIATLAGGDLRDVVPQPEGLWVTVFRAARAVLLSYEGETVLEVSIPALSTEREDRIASIAWRAVPRPGGGIAVAHQRHTNRTVSTVAPPEDPFGGPSGGAYGGFDPISGQCLSPLVSSAVTRIDPDGSIFALEGALGPLPVDIAVAPSERGEQVRVISAALGDAGFTEEPFDEHRVSDGFDPRCGRFVGGVVQHEQSISVALAGSRAIVQTQFPSRLIIDGAPVPLDTAERTSGDVGHALFHVGTSSGITCASCHPEGGEDGVRWSFFEVGARRTQELRGGLLGTAPFHWSGDRAAMTDIMNDVFRARMGGGSPTDEQIDAVGQWLDAVPLPHLEPADALATEGAAVFTRSGCDRCHSGEMGTNNELADMGRGAFQVPPLAGVSFRGPWMHDGCASTLESTFVESCAGAEHSVALSAHEVEALTAHLRTR